MDDTHKLLLDVIKEIKAERMNQKRKFRFTLKKIDPQVLFLCYRTGELLFILTNHDKIRGKKEVIELIHDFFGNCTRNAFRYIHLDDLIYMIEFHGEHGYWCSILQYH